MRTYAGDALSALGDPTRRVIFERLAEQPQAVVDLARGMPVSRPAVSQHLRVLRDVGLVRIEPAGNRRIYHLDPAGLAAVRAYFDQFWTTALASYKAAVEQPQEEQE